MVDYVPLICPFCREEDFDGIGLKRHLLSGWCEKFDEVPLHDPKPAVREEGAR